MQIEIPNFYYKCHVDCWGKHTPEQYPQPAFGIHVCFVCSLLKLLYSNQVRLFYFWVSYVAPNLMNFERFLPENCMKYEQNVETIA